MIYPLDPIHQVYDANAVGGLTEAYPGAGHSLDQIGTVVVY
jgi:hypothetical protein